MRLVQRRADAFRQKDQAARLGRIVDSLISHGCTPYVIGLTRHSNQYLPAAFDEDLSKSTLLAVQFFADSEEIWECLCSHLVGTDGKESVELAQRCFTLGSNKCSPV